MAFENLKNVVRVGTGPVSCFKLSLAAAATSRPALRPWFEWLLRICADRKGVLWVKAICELSGRNLHYGLRLSDLPSDLLSFYEHCVHNSYRLDRNKSPDAVIDGGANTGLFSLAVLSHWPEAKTLAVEPLPANVEILRAHLERNNLTAEIHPFCLAADRGEAKFYVRDANRGGLNRSDPFHREIAVRTIPLSDLYSPLRGRRVLIKLDIEGAEMPVIAEFLKHIPTKVNLTGELHHWKSCRARLVEMFRDAGWSVDFFSEDAVCVLFSAKSPDWE